MYAHTPRVGFCRMPRDICDLAKQVLIKKSVVFFSLPFLLENILRVKFLGGT